MSAALDLLIDATALGTASGRRGIGRYQRALLAELGRHERVHVRALVRRGTTLPEGTAPVVVARHAPGRFAAREHDALLPWTLRWEQAEVFHGAAPDAPKRTFGPWVQTLFDLIPLVFSDPALAAERRRLLSSGRRLRKADAIVAISRHAADEGIRLLGLDPSKVHIAPLGVGDEFSPGETSTTDPPYVLLVSEYSRRKGYQEAFALIDRVAQAGHPHRLRIAGQVAPWVAADLTALVAAAPRPDRIDIVGYVEDLPELYRGADVVLVPSRYEGFGLPALEGMACGRPVVAFSNSSLPEVMGEGGLLVPDGDVEALSAAVRSVLDSPSLAADLAGRGLDRAAGFSWSRCATVHIEAYEQAAARR